MSFHLSLKEIAQALPIESEINSETKKKVGQKIKNWLKVNTNFPNDHANGMQIGELTETEIKTLCDFLDANEVFLRNSLSDTNPELNIEEKYSKLEIALNAQGVYFFLQHRNSNI